MNPRPATELSLVIPAFNEGRNLARTFKLLGEFQAAQERPAEIIFVDDGSTDGTRALLEQFAADHPEVTVLRNEINRGKGNAVRRGLLASRGRHVVFTDADLSYSLDDIPRFVEALDSGCDLVIGSRNLGDRSASLHPGRLRRTLSYGFKTLVSLLVAPGFSDTQCGYKGLSRKAILQIAHQLTISRFAFDVELLFLARRRGLRIEEVGVSLRHSKRSSLHVVWDSLRMLRDILRIRLNALLRRYD